MVAARQLECDVLIVGGGLVGSLLANALAGLPLSVVLVEARSIDTLAQPSFDSRVTALANGSQRVLSELGLWDSIGNQAQPIRHIHISERGMFGAARIDALDEGVRALGYTVENRTLGHSLWSPLRDHERFESLAPATVVDFECGDAAVEALVEDETQSRRTVRARLMVAADGAQSRLREALGIGSRIDDYDQQAIVVNCTTQDPHRARAFERFTRDGPLAFLPLTNNRVGVVWTLPTSEASKVLELDDDDFRRALQQAFGYRLGKIERVGRRGRHDLKRVRSRDLLRDRTVLIGSSAVALHPVAGQGFNLALRDVAALAEVIADSLDEGPADVGSDAILSRYRAWRLDDQRKLAGFTHALVQGFGSTFPGLSVLRGLGLLAFDLTPGAKSALARHTMGLAGRVPRLARHLSLAR